MNEIIDKDLKIDEKFYNELSKLNDWNKDFFKKTGRNRKSYVVTYGCQMNDHDSEKIAWMLEKMGYESTDIEEDADLLVFNTCAIRDNAEQKVYGKVGSYKTNQLENPELKLILCGCMMQMDNIRETIEKSYNHVNVVFGVHNLHKLPELLLKNIEKDEIIVDVLEDSMDIVEGMGTNRSEPFKGYVNITFGCNNFCTYCVVPYARGREISRKPEHIMEEVKELASNGCKEITLLGQNVNSYGKTLEGKPTFTDLLEKVNNIDGIKRIRFMTSHPKDISEELIAAFGKLDNLSKHLHLPVQSGNNEILKNMNRGYTREDYIEKIKKLREVCPDISISTDIIVGFPGETEEQFLDTLSLIEEVEYDFVYNFIYSLREGTKAADMDNHIDYDCKHDRFERLNKSINRIIFEKNKEYEGKVVDVLVDSVSKNDDSMLSGRSDDFKLVHFSGIKKLIGEIVPVRIEEASTFSMTGKLIK